MTRILTSLVCISLAAGALGCGPPAEEAAHPANEGSQPPPSPAETQKTPKPSADAAVPRAPRGLDAPDNDPAVVKLAREALVCFYEAECPAMGAWYEPFHMRGKQYEHKTLVNLLEDEKIEVRVLASTVLRGKKGEPGFHVDAAMSRRVLDALDRETNERAGRGIALAAGRIDLRATGLEERVMKLVRSDPRPWARKEIVRSFVDGNWDNAAVIALVKELVNDPDGNVRVEAVEALGVRELREEPCPFWLANLGHQDASVADASMYQITNYHRCKAQYEAAMDALEKRPLVFPEKLSALCDPRAGSDKLKKRAVTALDKWAQDASLQIHQRTGALEALNRCDAQLAKKTAAALSKDESESVRGKAAEIAGSAPAKP